MAGKRNIVNKTKGSARLITVAALAAGWLMAAAAAFSQDDVRSQEEMIVSARQYLEDRLYVRTISGYREALAAYQTENNPRYEDELLAIYKEGQRNTWSWRSFIWTGAPCSRRYQYLSRVSKAVMTMS